MKIYLAFLLFFVYGSLAGCFLDDLSDRQPITRSKNTSSILYQKPSVAMDENHALVGSQVLNRRGHFWEKGEDLPALNWSLSGGSVDIKDGMAIVADANKRQVKIFHLEETQNQWVMEADIAESEILNFGESVYIDKHWAVVGAPRSNVVFIYARKINDSVVSWVEQDRLTVGDDKDMAFGASVDKESNTLFVGANKADRVYIYNFNNNKWNLNQVLDHYGDGAIQGKQFGWSLDAHHNQLAIAAYGDRSFENSNEKGGLVHVYQYKQEKWQFFQTIRPFSNEGPIAGGAFGHNLEMNDFNLMVGDDELNTIFRFIKKHGKWQPSNFIEAPEGVSNSFAYRLAINNNNLLTGGENPYLFGPAVPKVIVTGYVLDPNNNGVSGATISGMLADTQTNLQGKYTVTLPTGWSGTLSAEINEIPSDVVMISPLIVDTQLDDLHLQEVPKHNFSAVIRLRDPISLVVSGMETPVEGGNVLLPNGWSGEIKPISENYIFEPEKIVIEFITESRIEHFRAVPKN